MRARTAIEVERCRQYILGRQSPQGGFCFYRYEPWGVEEPNASDTCAAVASLRLLGVDIPRRAELAAWPCNLQAADGGYPSLRIAEAALDALRLLDGEPKYDPRSLIQGRILRISQRVQREGRVRQWLDSAARGARLLCALRLPAEPLRASVSSHLGPERRPWGDVATAAWSVIDTWCMLDLLLHLRLEAPSATLQYLRACEDGRRGINRVPHAITTSLKVQLAGLRAFGCLAATPRHKDAIAAFAARCQSTAGGFARVPGALPNLRDTCRALTVLSALRDLRRSAACAREEPSWSTKKKRRGRVHRGAITIAGIPAGLLSS